FISSEMVAASSCDRLGGAGQDGWASQAGARAAPRLHPGADRSDASPHAAPTEGRAGGARGQRLAQYDLAVHAARGAAVQKKRNSPLSRPAPTSHVGVSAGDLGRLASTRGGWSSSTKPGSRPTWRRYADGGSKASACAASPRTATGAR